MLKLVVELCDKFRRWLGADEHIEIDFGDSFDTAAFLPRLPSDQIDAFVGGDSHKQRPEIVPVGQSREVAQARSATKTVKGTESDVLFVGNTFGDSIEPKFRHVHQ